jgi:transcriptional regulator with XRE-family HTH domain
MIADRLRLARRKSGLSHRGLSAATNGRITAQAIGKYERGESVPSSGVLVALSKALGVSVGYLMDAQDIDIQKVEFRTKTRATVRDRVRVEREVLECIKRYIQVESVLEFDRTHWQCPIKPPREIARVSDAEKLAADAR